MDSDPPGAVFRSPRFDNILNLRDVGRTINQFTGKKYFNDYSYLQSPCKAACSRQRMTYLF
jgi:hypothetical protein